MKTVAVIADKGGVGKTTLSIHLGVAAAQRGLESVILGCDPQACSEAWADIRNQDAGETLPPGVLTTQAIRVPQLVDKARANGADFLVIDTGANSDNAATYAVHVADFVLIPSSPRFFDIRGVEDMARRAQDAKKPYAVVLNRVLRGPYLADAQQYLESKGHDICPVALRERVAFANCVNNGQAAMESDPHGAAAEEFNSLFDWLSERLAINSPAIALAQ